MYIHQLFQKKIICWAIGYTRRKHNNRSNPDPFSYIIHRSRRPSHDKAIELARGLQVNHHKAKKRTKIRRITKLIWLLFHTDFPSPLPRPPFFTSKKEF